MVVLFFFLVALLCQQGQEQRHDEQELGCQLRRPYTDGLIMVVISAGTSLYAITGCACLGKGPWMCTCCCHLLVLCQAFGTMQ